MPAPARRANTRRPGGRVMLSFYPLVVVDPPVRLDEPHNPRLVELVEDVDARPGRERDARPHVRVGSQDYAVRVALDDGFELLHHVGAAGAAIVLEHHAAVLEIVDLELLGDGLGVNSPRR